MLRFKFYTQKDIKHVTRSRYGECKIGDKISCITNPEEVESFLKQSPAKFVLFGIPEDIGVRANYGRPGANTAWKPAVENILNLQDNSFFSAESLIVLGEVNVDDLMEQASNSSSKSKFDIERLRKLVEFIDSRVVEIVEMIIAANKIPIVIGGGH